MFSPLFAPDTEVVCILFLIKDRRELFQIFRRGMWMMPEGSPYGIRSHSDVLRELCMEHLVSGTLNVRDRPDFYPSEYHGDNTKRMSSYIHKVAIEDTRSINNPDSQQSRWWPYQRLIEDCHLTPLTSVIVKDFISRGLLL